MTEHILYIFIDILIIASTSAAVLFLITSIKNEAKKLLIKKQQA